MATKKTNKSAWIRSQSTDISAKDLVAKAKAAGIKISEGMVYTTRSEARRKGAPKAGGAPRKVGRPAASGVGGSLDAMIREIVRTEIRAYFSALK